MFNEYKNYDLNFDKAKKKKNPKIKKENEK
jgi:hypothetical protein